MTTSEAETDTERRARADVFSQLVHQELQALKKHVADQTEALTRMSSDHAQMRESLLRIEASITADTELNRKRLEWDQGAQERWKSWSVGVVAIVVAVGGGILGLVEMVRKLGSH